MCPPKNLKRLRGETVEGFLSASSFGFFVLESSEGGIYACGARPVGRLGVIALTVFGPKQLPELAKTIGKVTEEPKKTTEEVESIKI